MEAVSSPLVSGPGVIRAGGYWAKCKDPVKTSKGGGWGMGSGTGSFA